MAKGRRKSKSYVVYLVRSGWLRCPDNIINKLLLVGANEGYLPWYITPSSMLSEEVSYRQKGLFWVLKLDKAFWPPVAYFTQASNCKLHLMKLVLSSAPLGLIRGIFTGTFGSF